MRRSEIPPRIEWECTRFGDDGVITRWTDTLFDLSRVGATTADIVDVTVSFDDASVLHVLLLLDAQCERLVFGARCVFPHCSWRRSGKSPGPMVAVDVQSCSLVTNAVYDTEHPAVGALLNATGAGFTGTAVTDHHVLTAATGVTQLGSPPQWFRLGSTFVFPEVVLNVVGVAVHPDYDPVTRAHDFAVVTLDQPVPASYGTIALGEPQPVSAGSTLAIVGYGMGADGSAIRRRGQFVVDKVSESQLFADHPASLPTPGDTGAPVMVTTPNGPSIVGVVVGVEATSATFARVVHDAVFISIALGWYSDPTSPSTEIRTSPTDPRAGIPVQFHIDAAPGSQVDWAFGDGTSSGPGDHHHIEHVFPASQRFTIRATVLDDDGPGATSVVEVDVGPGGPPQLVAGFTWSPDPVEVGATVTFDAGATYDPAGQVRRYGWSWGDGTSPVHTFETYAVHVFAEPGDATVTLTAMTPWDEPAVHSEVVQIHAAP